MNVDVGYPPQITGPGPPVQTTETGQGWFTRNNVYTYSILLIMS